jgi:protein TonB
VTIVFVETKTPWWQWAIAFVAAGIFHTIPLGVVPPPPKRPDTPIEMALWKPPPPPPPPVEPPPAAPPPKAKVVPRVVEPPPIQTTEPPPPTPTPEVAPLPEVAPVPTGGAVLPSGPPPSGPTNIAAAPKTGPPTPVVAEATDGAERVGTGPAFNARAYQGIVRERMERVKQYPHKARVLGLVGRVMVLVEIDENGKLVAEPRIVKGSGHKILDEEALRMATAASPYPRPQGARSSLTVKVAVPIEFRLE